MFLSLWYLIGKILCFPLPPSPGHKISHSLLKATPSPLSIRVILLKLTAPHPRSTHSWGSKLGQQWLNQITYGVIGSPVIESGVVMWPELVLSASPESWLEPSGKRHTLLSGVKQAANTNTTALDGPLCHYIESWPQNIPNTVDVGTKDRKTVILTRCHELQFKPCLKPSDPPFSFQLSESRNSLFLKEISLDGISVTCYWMSWEIPE